VHLAPVLGHVPLARLSPQAIQGYYSAKLAAGLSPSTLRRHAAVLHVALRHAVRWGLLVRNPCDMTDPPRPRRTEMRVLDDEQVRLFLGEAKRSSPYYLLYLAALTTGMRQGELLGLRWQDVDLTLGAIAVRQTFYRLGKQQLFKEPKSAKARRSVSTPVVLSAALRRFRAEQDARRQELGEEYEDRGLVFCQENGRPLHAHNITQGDLQRVLKLTTLRKDLLEQGVPEAALPKPLPRIRFHDLRHSHATMLAQQGVHPKVVQERLGHGTPAFTLSVYSHVLPGMQEEAIRQLEGRFFSGASPSRDLDAR
jgi:integrase